MSDPVAPGAEVVVISDRGHLSGAAGSARRESIAVPTDVQRSHSGTPVTCWECLAWVGRQGCALCFATIVDPVTPGLVMPGTGKLRACRLCVEGARHPWRLYAWMRLNESTTPTGQPYPASPVY